MSSIAISLIVFVCVFGAALLATFLRPFLPEHHLSADSKGVVNLGMGLVATMSALVLGLLIASAKNSYDAQSTALTEMSAKIVVLDRVLAHYGPETKEMRDLLRSTVARLLDQMDQMGSKDRTGQIQLEPPSTGREVLLDKVQELSPKDDRQRSFQAQALSVSMGLLQTRWLQYEQTTTAVSFTLLVVLVFWLTVIFFSFGLFAPRNVTVVATLLICALSVSSAILLILEMYTPYGGLIKISSAPLRSALAHLGQ
jgi:hypothetical protein